MQTSCPLLPESDCEVAVVGGGPVGLLLANLLGQAGVRVLVLEKREDLPGSSQAIGITPPSLSIVATLGLAEAFVNRGVPIRDVFVHGDSGPLGCCSFRKIPGEYPFVLSLPQRLSMAMLAENLAKHAAARLVRGTEVVGSTQHDDGVSLSVQQGHTITAKYAVACDGHRSPMREQVTTQTRARSYACHFVMGDFTGQSGMGDDAHVFFTADGAVESFPLPGGLRRWIVQTSEPMQQAPSGFIAGLVHQRTGIILDACAQVNQTWFTPKRLDCRSYVRNRLILCGDAAHVMSPIGGQGMNVGFADAAHLAHALTTILHHEGDAKTLLATYERERSKAANVAANRAAAGMWLGTRRGHFTSQMRALALREVLLGFMSAEVSKHYAMMR
jgi:2-polyprenyl-6-methoxyphenol hydroxylase-like FAD-dependent oxidoreductase